MAEVLGSLVEAAVASRTDRNLPDVRIGRYIGSRLSDLGLGGWPTSDHAAMLDAKALAVLRVIEARFGAAPNRYERAIAAEPNPDVLDRLLDVAATSPSLEVFCADPTVARCLEDHARALGREVLKGRGWSGPTDAWAEEPQAGSDDPIANDPMLSSIARRRLTDAGVPAAEVERLLSCEAMLAVALTTTSHAILRVAEVRFGGLTTLEQVAIIVEPRANVLDDLLAAAATVNSAAEFRTDGRAQAWRSVDWLNYMRAAILQCIQARFSAVPAVVQARVTSESHPLRLKEWGIRAVEVGDLAEFEHLMAKGCGPEA